MNSDTHLSGYQARDIEVVDYQMTELGDTGLMFRGPFPEKLSSGEYFSCIGAAQTLGCFVENPFPNLLAQEIGLEPLNLGYGGAGPEFFEKHDKLIETINGGQFLIAQVMSGRSQSNSVFNTGGLEYVTHRASGKQLGAADAWKEVLLGSEKLRSLPPSRITHAIARRLASPHLRSLVGETRSNWAESSRSLFNKVSVPIILFWFSKRTPAYPQDFTTQPRLFGEFPHLINETVLSQVKPDADHYVECVTDRGSPQPLFSRHTGEPITVDPTNDRPDLSHGEKWTHNLYYPSPEMHEDAAQALLPICRDVLTKVGSPHPQNV